MIRQPHELAEPLADLEPETLQEPSVESEGSLVTEPETSLVTEPETSLFMDDEAFEVAISGPLRKAILGFKPIKDPVADVGDAVKVDVTEPTTKTDRLDLSDEELGDLESSGTYARELNDTSLDDYDTTQSHHPKYDTFNTHGDADGALAYMAEGYAKEIDEARRSVIYDDQLADLAEELGQSKEFTEKFMKRKLGEGVNAEQIMAARSILLGSAKRLKILAKQIVDGDDSSKTQVMFMNQFDFHRQWMAQFMGARAELGRGLRALRGDVPGPGSPGVGTGNMRKGIEVSQDRIAELAGAWSGQLNVKQAALDVLANDELAGVNGIVAGSKGGMNRYAAAFVEHFVGSILSGIKTQLVNIGGNTLMTVKAPIDIYIGSKFGRNLPNSQDKIQKGEASAFLFGLFNGFHDATQAMAIAFKTGEQYGDVGKFELGRGKAISSQALGWSGPWGWLADVYGPVARFPMERMLGPMDAFFKVINGRAKYSQLAYRQAMMETQELGLSKDEAASRLLAIMHEPSEHMIKESDEFALYQTFQNALGEGGQGFQKWVNSFAELKWMIPFVRTPTNIAKVGFAEHTVLGLRSARIRSELFPKPDPTTGQYAPGAIAKSQVARARMTYGSMMAMSLVALAMNGYITGSGPKDATQRDALKASKWKRRSVAIRDENGRVTRWVSFDRMEPFSLLAVAAADIAEVYKAYENHDITKERQEELETAVMALTVAISEATINKTFMMNIHEFMRALTDPGRYMGRFIGQSANAVVPLAGLRRDLRKLLDPTMRETQGIIDTIRNSTPGLSMELTPSQDVWGEDWDYDSWFWNPYPSPKVDMDDVDVEVTRLLEETGEAAITMTPERIANVKLTKDEHYILNRLSRQDIKVQFSFRDGAPTIGDYWAPNVYGENDQGRLRPIYLSKPSEGEYLNMREVIDRIISSNQYLGGDPDALMTNFGKVELLRQIQSEFNDAAKQWMLASEGYNEDGTLRYRTDAGRRAQLKWQQGLRQLYGDDRVEGEMRERNIAPLAPEGKEPFFDWTPNI